MELLRGYMEGASGGLAWRELLTWAGIALCLSQAAFFSGLNLAIFSVSRLRLEVEAAGGSRDALKVLGLRRQSNLTLATVLWGNVAVMVLLTLLSNSVFAGVGAFVFSTIAITFFGEIVPQAYFSRDALRIAAACTPLLKAYRVLLFPIAGISAALLDWWFGPEAIALFRERDFRALIAKHVEAAECDVGQVEGAGVLNFLDLDDMMVSEEGEALDPASVVMMPFAGDKPVLPAFEQSPNDPFLRRLDASGKKWVIFIDQTGAPRLALDTHTFLREALLGRAAGDRQGHWYRPIVVADTRTRLGDVISKMNLKKRNGAEVVEQDLILVWGDRKRIITGADLLRRLLKGIAHTDLAGSDATRPGHKAG